MASSGLLIALLSIATLCLLLITVAILSTTTRLRATLQRLDALLPDAGQVLIDLKRSGRQVRRLLTRTDATAEEVERVVRGACQVASEAMDRLSLLRNYVGRMGAEPRSHHRNGKGH